MIDRLLRFGVDILDIFRSGKFSYGELSKLKRIQYYDESKLNMLIDYRIKRTLKQAYFQTSFYKKLYDSQKIILDKIKKANDLYILPIISKSMLRENFPKQITSYRNLHRARYDKTSGSTGEPFEFYYDINSVPIRYSAYMLFNTWMNVNPHAKHVQIASPKPQTKYNRLINKVFRKYKISTLDIKQETIAKVIQRINMIDPVYLEGYSASLYNTARLVEELALELHIKPRAVIATSEDLIESHRKKIEDVFDSTVYNRYGSREFSGALAQECSLFEGLHVNSALVYVEIVDDDGMPVGEGERGRIIVTDFHNDVMPFIRYDIGDSAIKGPEIGECGRTFPIIKDIKGKSEFFLISKKDERIPIETIQTYLFHKYASNVTKFQFLHNSKGTLTLKIVPAKNFSQDMLGGMDQYLESTLNNFTINIEIVEEIPPLKSGKTPYFIVGFPH